MKRNSSNSRPRTKVCENNFQLSEFVRIAVAARRQAVQDYIKKQTYLADLQAELVSAQNAAQPTDGKISSLKLSIAVCGTELASLEKVLNSCRLKEADMRDNQARNEAIGHSHNSRHKRKMYTLRQTQLRNACNLRVARRLVKAGVV